MADDENKTENNTADLSDALDNVGEELEKDEQQQPAQTFFPDTPKIVQWVVKYSGGLIKDEKQATYVLFGVVGLVIIISLFLFLGGGGGGAKPLPYEETYKPFQ